MENIDYIKNYSIGDRVTSTDSFWLDKGFRGVTGVIKTLEKDHADSWQYVIVIDDGRTLVCDDSHLPDPPEKAQGLWMVYSPDEGLSNVGDYEECKKAYVKELDFYMSGDFSEIDESDKGYQIILAKLDTAAGWFENPEGTYSFEEHSGTGFNDF